MSQLTARADATGTHPRRRREWLTLAVVSTGLFLAVLSTTVVSVALPTLGRDLDATTTALQWVVDAYVIVYASLLVPGGALGDRVGRKGLFVSGALVFAAGSLVCGLAPSMPVLLAGRVLQGVGPALLVPGSLTIVRAVFTDERRRAVAIGLWSTSSGLGLAVGPPLGGLVVTGLGWRWVFMVNVPLALALTLAAARWVPRLPRTLPGGRFDWFGALLAVAALALVTLAVIEGQHRAATSPLVLSAVTGGSVALVGFVALQHHRSDPLVDVSLFRQPAFTAAGVAALVVFFAFVGALVYLSAYFQQVQHHTAIVAGLDVAPIGVALAVTAAWSGRLVARIGERRPMLVGLVLAGAATLGLLRLEPATPQAWAWCTLALLGTGIGLCGTPITTLAMSAVDTGSAGMASAVINVLRQVGQVFGVAVLGALVYARLPQAGAGQPLPPPRAEAFVQGLHHATAVAGLALLATAALVGVLCRPARPARHEPADARARSSWATARISHADDSEA